MYWGRETFLCTDKQQLWTYCRIFSQRLREVQWCRRVCRRIQRVVTTLSSSAVVRPVCVYHHATCVMARTTVETGPTNSTAVSHILTVLSTHTHMVQLLPLHPKPHRLLPRPRLNPDWFYLPGTGLPRLSWKKAVIKNGCSTGSGRGSGSGSNSCSSSSSSSCSLYPAALQLS